MEKKRSLQILFINCKVILSCYLINYTKYLQSYAVALETYVKAFQYKVINSTL